MDPARFARLDRDGDGVLTLRELGAVMQAHCAQRVQQVMARFDRDGDGRITRAELAPPPGGDERRARPGASPRPGPNPSERAARTAITPTPKL
jgi:hypothetical protein